MSDAHEQPGTDGQPEPVEEPAPAAAEAAGGDAAGGEAGGADAADGEAPLTVEDVLGASDGVAEPGAAAVAADAGGELAAAERQRDEYLTALQHLQADFENYRKRMAKQQAEAGDRAAEVLVVKLLPVLDVADLAMAHGGGKEVEQVWTALLDALGKEGLERIEPGAGGAFDPTLHDAVAHEPGDEGDDQAVAETLRAGYAWKGRVLRAAMVKVRG